MNKPSFIISAPVDTYSGYGARSRDIVKSIVDLDKYDVKVIAQPWGNCAWNFCNKHEKWKWLKDLFIPGLEKDFKPDIWMQISIPSEFRPLGTYNIGCTAGIESTGCDHTWIEGLNRMNMNWVSSKHSKRVFESAKFENRNKENNILINSLQVQVPIHVVFEGIDLDTYNYVKNEDISLDLSEVKESFNYLFVGHWMEGELGHDRKNVGLMIKEFFDLWKNKKQRPGLILKTSIGKDSYISRDSILRRIKRIKALFKGHDLPNVYLLNGELSNGQMNELYNHPKVKAFLCYTKGEGYGRPLAEFCMSKKPIICSGWSGQLDFLNPAYTGLIPGDLEPVHKSSANQWLKAETQWFRPSLSHAKKLMKEVYVKYNKWLIKGKQQGHYIKTNFTKEKMGELVGNILKHNIPEFPKHVDLKLPEEVANINPTLPTIN